MLILVTRGKQFIHRHHFSVGIFLSVVLFVIAMGSLVVVNGEPLQPEDAHIVSLAVDGKEKVIPTRAVTVGDLLSRQGIRVGEFDYIDPSAETFISGDNFRIAVYRAQPLTIIDNRTTTRVLSPYLDDRQAVINAGITLNPEDDVLPQYNENYYQTRVLGRKLRVQRANTITINLYGTPTEIRTKLSTVGDLLAERGITPATDDIVTPDRTTPLENGLAIFITKFGRQLLTVEEAIPFTREVTEDANLSSGAQNITQTGVNGKRVVTYELDLTNGVESARRKIQENVLIVPIAEKVVRGTKPLFADYNADGIPARVFCGSPKQGNWKNINVGNAAAGRSLAAERGWTGTEFDALLELFACESSWNERAGNPVSGAYGIPQSWPASKMASFGDDYMTNPITQLRWGLNYIAARYGSPSAALAFHYRTNYY